MDQFHIQSGQKSHVASKNARYAAIVLERMSEMELRFLPRHMIPQTLSSQLFHIIHCVDIYHILVKKFLVMPREGTQFSNNSIIENQDL